MPHDLCAAARDFLTGEHLLTPTEAEQALDVAADVLAKGCALLLAAAEAGDIPAMGQSSHALKGNLLNLGLADAAQTAEALGESLRRGDLATARATADDLCRLIAPLTVRTPADRLDLRG